MKCPHPAKTSRPRERQSIWCCGVNYGRWRFVGTEFSESSAQHCTECGRKLLWPEYAGPVGRKSALNYYQRKRDAFYKQGLTSRGERRARPETVYRTFEALFDSAPVSLTNDLLIELDAVAAGVARNFEQMPPQVQSAMLRLGFVMARLRARIAKPATLRRAA